MLRRPPGRRHTRCRRAADRGATVDAIVVTAICPHTAGGAPARLTGDCRRHDPADSALERTKSSLSFDASGHTDSAGERLGFGGRTGHRLIRLGVESFFKRLRKKLHWEISVIGRGSRC